MTITVARWTTATVVAALPRVDANNWTVECSDRTSHGFTIVFTVDDWKLQPLLVVLSLVVAGSLYFRSCQGLRPVRARLEMLGGF